MKKKLLFFPRTAISGSLLVFLLPPILAVAVVRQLLFSIRESAKATPVDSAVGVIYDALNANGITIPFPQCDIHLIRDDE